MLFYLFHIIFKKKNKFKRHFFVLFDKDICIYRNQKEFQRNKRPKCIINLENIFNIAYYNDPEMIKSQITIMDETDTYCIILSGPLTPFEWYNRIVGKIRDFRSKYLNRDVKINEFFDISFDCTISIRPKMKKDYGNQTTDVLDDLYNKVMSNNNLTSHVRFCMYYNLVVICNIGIRACCDDIPPFNSKDYIKFPTNVIRDFGKQEKYIFLRIGRCSEIGCGELWFKLESSEKAREAHMRIMELFDSATERRKSDVRKCSSQNLSVRIPLLHRERSNTNPISITSLSSQNEKKEERAQTWGDNVDINERKASSASINFYSNTSTNSKKSSRNLSPLMAHSDFRNSNLNISKPENDVITKKSSVSGLFLKLLEPIHAKMEKSNDISHNDSVVSLTNVIDNSEKPPSSTIKTNNTESDFCFEEDIKKASYIDSKQMSNKPLHISPKRQQSFNCSDLTPPIVNLTKALSTTDYVTMNSVEELNIPLTQFPLNNITTKEYFKFEEGKNYYSDKSNDDFLRSRTNTTTSKNLSIISERSRKNTCTSFSSDNSKNIINERGYSLSSRSNNNDTIYKEQKSHKRNLIEYDRKRSYSLGNKALFQNNLLISKNDKRNFSMEFKIRKSEASSLTTSSINSSIEKLELHDHIEIEFGSSETPSEQLHMTSSENISLSSRNSSIDKVKKHPILVARDLAVKKIKLKKNINSQNGCFLFEKTYEISSKLPKNNSVVSNKLIQSKVDLNPHISVKKDSVCDNTYEIVRIPDNTFYTEESQYPYECGSPSSSNVMSKKITPIIKSDISLTNEAKYEPHISPKNIIKIIRSNSLASKPLNNDYAYFDSQNINNTHEANFENLKTITSEKEKNEENYSCDYTILQNKTD
uniref:IRS-type PTB domain-containing protein n=1 Tax=Parastrongyloides trichosuri TaxID=131310 RepID=A0A0N4ZSR6_PARTI